MTSGQSSNYVQVQRYSVFTSVCIFTHILWLAADFLQM